MITTEQLAAWRGMLEMLDNGIDGNTPWETHGAFPMVYDSHGDALINLSESDGKYRLYFEMEVAAFIAAAPTMVRELLAERERLREMLDEACISIGCDYAPCCDCERFAGCSNSSAQLMRKINEEVNHE